MASAPLTDAAKAFGAPGPQPGDVFAAIDDPADIPVRADSVTAGRPPLLAWPLDPVTGQTRASQRINQVLLLRATVLGEPKLLAFSAICTHAGCLVSGWVAQTQHLRCPCHETEYDTTQNGAVMSGPAPLPLPALPVHVRGGLVEVAGPFSARPGGHTTRTM